MWARIVSLCCRRLQACNFAKASQQPRDKKHPEQRSAYAARKRWSEGMREERRHERGWEGHKAMKMRDERA